MPLRYTYDNAGVGVAVTTGVAATGVGVVIMVGTGVVGTEALGVKLGVGVRLVTSLSECVTLMPNIMADTNTRVTTAASD